MRFFLGLILGLILFPLALMAYLYYGHVPVAVGDATAGGGGSVAGGVAGTGSPACFTGGPSATVGVSPGPGSFRISPG